MDTSPTRPIVLRSHISGLSLRLKPGGQEFRPQTGQYELRFGRWAKFERGQCTLKANDYLPIYGSREDAVSAIQKMRNYHRDFTILDIVPPTTNSPTAAGAAVIAPAKRLGRPPKNDNPQGTLPD